MWKPPDGKESKERPSPRDPIARKFYSDLIQQLGPSGQCAIFPMTVEGKAIAGQFALLDGNTCYLLKIGYDENYKHLSPGNMLLEQLQRLQNSNIRQVNLITGWIGTRTGNRNPRRS
ncbi:MAG: GNAT family N-acetyltransferase [Planctomycetales bacterium]